MKQNKEDSKRRNWDEWSTSHEIRFLNNIGTFHHNAPYYPWTDRQKLKILKKYKTAMELRENWGNVNKELVRIHLAKLIARLEAEQKLGIFINDVKYQTLWEAIKAAEPMDRIKIIGDIIVEVEEKVCANEG